MAKRQTIIPQYGTVMKRGVLYYRTRIKDANGKLVAIYAKTPEELYNKETLTLEQINLYCSRQRTIMYSVEVQNGCVYFTSAGLQEYIAKCTHRAKPTEKNATYRKPRRAGV